MRKAAHTIQAGKFKAICLQLMDEVQEKHISFTITKHGKPIAQLIPLDEHPVDLFGSLKNSVTIKEDIISPIDVHWDAQE